MSSSSASVSPVDSYVMPDDEFHNTLKDTFALIDTDNSGTICPQEFGALLRLQGESVSDEDAANIMEQIDVDGDSSALTFEEFIHIMEDIKILNDRQGGNAKFDLVKAFTEKAKEQSHFFQSKDPLYVQMKKSKADADAAGIRFSPMTNARMKLAEAIDGNRMQIVVLILIALDVVCVICELLIVATMCPCTGVYPGDSGSSYGYYYGSSDYSGSESTGRKLAGGGSESCDDDSGHRMLSGEAWGALGVVETTARRLVEGFAEIHSKYGYVQDRVAFQPQGVDWRRLAGGAATCGEGGQRRLAGGWAGVCCCEDKYSLSEVQYEYEVWLHWLSVSILFVFALQILALMVLYGTEFFKNAFYVLDFVIVFGALYMELLHAIITGSAIHGGPLLTLLLSWRIIRVVHGMVSSVELNHKREHDKIKFERANTLKFIINTRRKGASKSLYFMHYHDALKEQYGIVSADQKAYHEEAHVQDAAVGTHMNTQNSTAGKFDDSSVVHTDAGAKLKAAMEAAHMGDGMKDPLEENVDGMKTLMRTEITRRLQAEAMYVEIYEHYAEQMDHLKEHTDKMVEDPGAQH